MNKKLQKIILIAILLNIFELPVYSQFNAATNAYGTKPEIKVENGTGATNTPGIQGSGITCGSSTFWGDGGGAVNLKLSGGVITVVDTVPMSGGGGYGIAFCNNLEGNSFSPTFYKGSADFHHASWFNGTGWTTDLARTPWEILNLGGNGSYLYYTGTDTVQFKTTAVIEYNGTSFFTAFQCEAGRVLTVADLSVDDYGNVWAFTGLDNGALETDSIEVISPSGRVIKSYYFPLNTNNAYGAFLLNDTLYIGLGSSNPNYPNTVVPVIIKGDSAIAGTAVPMVLGAGFDDLGSCQPGSPLGVISIPAEAGPSIFPDPADEELNLAGINIGKGRTELKLFDLLGKQIFNTVITSPEYKLNTANFNNGIYVIEINCGTRTTTQKILVQH